MNQKFSFTQGKWASTEDIDTTAVNWAIVKSHKTAINCGKKNIAMVNFFQGVDKKRNIVGTERDANVRLISCAPEILKALIELLKDSINEQIAKWGTMKKTSEILKYYKNEISIIEKATGKKWEGYYDK